MSAVQRWKLWVICLAFFGTIGALPQTHAQDSGDEGKRKVRIKVDPEFPSIARQMNLSGRVRIEAIVSADGRVMSTKVIGGSPVFVNAATDAVKKWKFEPASKETTEILEIDFGSE